MLPATRADAQFEALSGLASSFSDLAIQWGAFNPRLHEIHPETNPKSRWLGSYGAEFIFDIAKVNTSKKEKEKEKEKGNEKIKKMKCDTVGRGDPKERRVTYARGERDSVDIYALVSKCGKDEATVELEFGVGVFQTSRFKVIDAVGAMTGVFREAPTISVYATWLVGGSAAWRPYGAIRVGATELVSPTLENPLGKTFAATVPKSVEGGLVAGAYRKFLPQVPVTFFVEISYMYRPFTGISWAANTDDKTAIVLAPKGARSRLNFSGRSAMLGFQLTVKDPNKK
jgi:hypothetical protein